MPGSAEVHKISRVDELERPGGEVLRPGWTETYYDDRGPRGGRGRQPPLDPVELLGAVRNGPWTAFGLSTNSIGDPEGTSTRPPKPEEPEVLEVLEVPELAAFVVHVPYWGFTWIAARRMPAATADENAVL
jgi:hypothetical protein